MTLRAVRSLSLADQVFEQLAAEIMQRRYGPGSSLPAERSLAEIFAVNRHVVREALKRLAQLGLVKISQGGGTQVLDFERSAGLDMLVLLAEHAQGGDELNRQRLAVLEMRAAIAADMARLCALRADPHVRRDVLAIAADMAHAERDGLFALERRFWERVLDGADNIAYRLAWNSLLKGAHAGPELARPAPASEAKRRGERARIAAAIAAGDADAAEREARTAMRGAAERFAGTLPAPAGAAARSGRSAAARRAGGGATR